MGNSQIYFQGVLIKKIEGFFRSEYWFNFDHHFEIHDDIEVLKRMGLAYGLDCGEVPNEHISHIKACLPAALRDYVDQIIEGINFIFIF